MLRLITMLQTFKRDEKGLALTEYLILLGLLTAAVIAAVTLFGEQLGIQWGTWATWMSNADLGAPS
ncbi:MAG: Flp family type IVb pilin [Paracoccaceae bacterium]